LTACASCGGTGFEILEKDGREFARPCACRRPSGASAGDLLVQCRIPPRYEHCTLASFEPGTDSLTAGLSKVMNYCSGYPFLGDDEGLGLLFTGDNGVGKTHLAVAALRELATSKGARGQFWDFHELIREIRNSYDEATRTTELQVLAPVVEADILLLDDLGAWKMTDWMLDTLFFLLNSRYMAKRATIITTNFPDVAPEVAARDVTHRRKEYLVERVGVRLRSRLMEMCLVVRMQGNDHRQARQEANEVAVRGNAAPAPAAPAPTPIAPLPRPRFGG
jgi:DNA replication protein DnaC